MNLPSNSLYKETRSEILPKMVGKLTTFGGRFAILPGDIMARADLSTGAKLVFAGLAMESFSSDLSAVSTQALSIITGISKPQVIENLRVLAKVGLIETSGEPIKRVQPYRLLHPKFKASGERPAKPLTAHGAPPPVACVKCRRICSRLPDDRICRSCKSRVRVEGIARRVAKEEIEKAAL